MEKDLITVIVPIYNIEKYVSKCIQSIQMQDYHELEIILVDDGSSDKSGVIADSFAKTDNRMIVIHKENGGLSDARNTGVHVARGKYILFVDGDDYVSHNYVSSLYFALKETNSEMACSPLIFEYGNGLQKESAYFEQKIVKTEEMVDIAFRAKYSIGVTACSKLFTREHLEKNPFPIGKYHEDMLTINDIIYESSQIVLVPERTYHYVQRDASIMHLSINYESMFNGMDYLEKNIKVAESEMCRKAYIHRLFSFVNAYCKMIDPKHEKKMIKQIQKKLHPYIAILLADNDTEFVFKIKVFLLAFSPNMFALLKKIESLNLKRIMKKHPSNTVE